jgi:hypothetical protein
MAPFSRLIMSATINDDSILKSKQHITKAEIGQAKLAETMVTFPGRFGTGARVNLVIYDNWGSFPAELPRCVFDSR